MRYEYKNIGTLIYCVTLKRPFELLVGKFKSFVVCQN